MNQRLLLAISVRLRWLLAAVLLAVYLPRLSCAQITPCPGTPPYASLPVAENFESWLSRCGTSEVPSANWRATPTAGDNSWRRNDQGFSTAGWRYIIDEPAPYTTASSQGSYSARFHSYGTTSAGLLDLFVNLSAAGTKTLTFDYINPSGADKLEVQLSEDGGTTFASTNLLTLGTSATFSRQSVVISSTSATAVVRFKATSDYGNDDIGIDRLRLALTPCAQVTSAAVTTSSGTATASTAQLTFTAVSGAGSYYLTLTPTAGGTTATVTGSPVNLAGLTPNTSYTLTITTNCSGGGTSSPVPVVFTSAPAPAGPANDDCAGAIGLTPASTCTTVSGTTVGATQSLAPISCGGYTGSADDDVWYKFVATSTTHQVTVAGSASFDAVVDVRSGSCASSNNIGCADNTGGGGTETVQLTGLTVNATYYVRVYSYTTAAGAFTICVTGPADLVVDGTNSPYSAAGTYNNVTINSGGTANLSGNLTVVGTLTINSGGTLNTAGAQVLGTGNFALAAGGTLGVGSPAGISSSGATGSVQVAGSRGFSVDALYTYNGSADQITGTALPATVRTLTLANGAGLALTASLTATTAATLSTGVLSTGANTLTLGPSATLTEDADGYLTGTVGTTRNLNTVGSTQSFGGLGLTLTPSGSTLPGSTLVVRTTGTARTGAGTSQSVKRVFDIQPTIKTGLNVALTLTVRDDERNGITPANLRLFKSDNTGVSWHLQPSATLATTAASGSQPTTYTASLSGISNFSLWTLGDATSPLPVTLTTFTAEAQGSAALLHWTTASEVGNDHFEVEASADGASFGRLGTVAGAGSSQQAHHYTFTDANVARYATPLVYYRLRQVDTDGTATYSPVRTVALAGASAGLSLYPNPVHGGTATLLGAQPGMVVAVLDALGRTVATAPADASGTATLILPQGLAAGVYVVRAGQQALRLMVE